MVELEKIGSNFKDISPDALINDSKKLKSHITKLRKEMLAAANDLDFEKAADIRDKIKILNEAAMKFSGQN